MHAHADADNPLQGYFDWQVTTLMLAYDIIDPLPREREEKVHERRAEVEQEVRRLSMAQVPQEYLEHPDEDWPPQVLRAITLATLRRAAEIAGRK